MRLEGGGATSMIGYCLCGCLHLSFEPRTSSWRVERRSGYKTISIFACYMYHLLYSGTLLKEKLLQSGEKYNFCGENFCRLLDCATKEYHAPKLSRENCCKWPQNAKVLSLESVQYCTLVVTILLTMVCSDSEGRQVRTPSKPCNLQ